MKPTPGMIAAAASSDAAFDGRGRLSQLSRADRERYTQRAEQSLTAALAAIWQPIESAPKDVPLIGTRMNALEKIQWLGRVIWVDERYQHDRGWLDDNDKFVEPTHWMPFPSPPNDVTEVDEERHKMSYDMSIGDENYNYTWNVSEMWYAAMPGKGIRSHYGMTGREALVPLRKIRKYMEDHREALIAMEPDNGWGSYEGAYGFICDLIQASIRNKDKVWSGD